MLVVGEKYTLRRAYIFAFLVFIYVRKTSIARRDIIRYNVSYHLFLPVIFAALRARMSGFASSGDNVNVDVACQLSAVVRETTARSQRNSLRSLRPSQGSTPLLNHSEEDAADRRSLLELTMPDVAMNLKTFCYACVIITLAIPRLVTEDTAPNIYSIQAHRARPLQPY